MNIEEKAKAYAESRALELLQNAIEKAYTDGYEEGLKDADNSKANLVVDGVEYVDLGLPSGTKWASSYLNANEEKIYLTYNEAANLNIPTIDQFKELLNYCSISSISYKSGIVYGKQMLGCNGNYVKYYSDCKIYGDKKEELACPAFWLKEGSQEGQLRDIANFANSRYFSFEFLGNRFPVILVK